MSNNKQSSVEWLIEQYKLVGMLTTAQVEKAKAMHKDEIIKAGADNCYPSCEVAKIDAEQYYNETFGGNK